MRVTIGSTREKYSLYAFDVESHNDAESIANKETSIWLACLINENSKREDERSFLYNMPDVIDRIGELAHRHHGQGGEHGENILIYVYNLAFEYSFLLPVLYELGWTWWSGKDEDAPDHSFSAVTRKTCSTVWEIKLHYDKKSGKVIFRDLAQMYHGSLRSIAASFGLETQKGEIDYTLNRLHDYVVTEEEKTYCFNDTRIVIEVLQKVVERKDTQFFKCMSASTYACQLMIHHTKERSPYSYFRKYYPKIEGEESVFLRHTIAGGITYPTPLYQFKEIDVPVCHIDANQMHPSSAYLNEYPYGKGEYHKGRPTKRDHYISAVHIKLSYSGVKLHSVIKLIGIDMAEDLDLYLWDFEIELLKKCYENVEIKYIEYYEYKARRLPWRDFYVHNWTERLKAIEKGDSFGKYQYKLLNNSSYGKLIERPHLESYENIIDELGHINSKVISRELTPTDDAFFNAKFTYIPVGSCIPAYSRKCLIEKALDLGWRNVVYFDTDSIFFVWNEETEKKLRTSTSFEKKLGGWKIEEILEKSQFTAPKRYKGETEDGDVYVKAAGFNFKDVSDDEMEFDTIDLITGEHEVMRAYRVKGGTILDYQTKEIKIDKKYQAIYDNNVH